MFAAFGARVLGLLLILDNNCSGVGHMLPLGTTIAYEEGLVGVGNSFSWLPIDIGIYIAFLGKTQTQTMARTQLIGVCGVAVLILHVAAAAAAVAVVAVAIAAAITVAVAAAGGAAGWHVAAACAAGGIAQGALFIYRARCSSQFGNR